jgi:hypothetical protein
MYGQPKFTGQWHTFCPTRIVLCHFAEVNILFATIKYSQETLLTSLQVGILCALLTGPRHGRDQPHLRRQRLTERGGSPSVSLGDRIPAPGYAPPALIANSDRARCQADGPGDAGPCPAGAVEGGISGEGVGSDERWTPPPRSGRRRSRRWDRMIDVNVRGLLHGIAAALPVFTAQGSGHFVTVASNGAHQVVPTGAARLVVTGRSEAVENSPRKTPTTSPRSSATAPTKTSPGPPPRARPAASARSTSWSTTPAAP